MNPMKALTVLCACALVACGGGSSGGDDPASVVTFNADAAFATLLSTPVNFPSLLAKDSAGNQYAMNVSFTPTADFTFNGAAYKQSIQNVVITKNGSKVSGENLHTQYLYTIGPTKIAAILPAVRASFAPVTYIPNVLSLNTPLPTAGVVGSTGTYANVVSYARQLSNTSTAGAEITGNSQATWSIEGNRSTTAYACIATAIEKDCLKVNANGAIQAAKILLSIDGQLLTFQ